MAWHESITDKLRQTIQRYYSPPGYTGTSDNVRRAKLLYSELLGLEVALALQFSFTLITEPGTLPRIAPLLLVFPFFLLLRSRIQPARSRRQSILLVAGLFVLTYSQTFAYGGVRSPAYAALTVLMLIAGLLLGFRAGFLVATASFMGGLALIVLELRGWLAPLAVEASLSSFFISNIAFMVIALTTLYLAVRDLREAYRSERSAVQEELKIRDALQQSDARYQAIVEDQTDLINRHTTDGTIVYVNEAYARFYNHTPQQMLGQPLSSVVPARAWEEIQRILSGLTPERPLATSEHRVVREDGEEIWLQWQNRLILDRAGQPVEYQGVGRDITAVKLAERELQESEAKFRTLAEKSPNMIFINQDGRIIYANQACIDGMGYAREEFYADDFSFLDLIASDSRPQILEHLAQHQRGEEVAPYEAQLVTRQGELMQAIHSTRLIHINGRSAILGVITDVTERRQVEQALIRLKKAVEASGEVIFMTDPQGMFTYVNPEFTKTYGYNAEEVVGSKTPRILKSGQMEKELYRDFWAQILDGQNVRMEIVNRTRDGRLLTVEASVNPIINERDELIGFLAAQRDISERVRMQEDLRQREQQYRAVAESAFIGIGITDPEERITFINSTLAQTLGYEPESLIGTSIEQLVSAQDFALVREQTARQRRGGERSQYEIRMRRADGAELLLQVSAAPLLGPDGTFRGSLSVVTDITDKRQAENDLKRQLDELLTLQKVANAAAESLQEDRIIERITDIIAGAFYPDHVGVLLLDETLGGLRVHRSYHGIPDLNFDDIIPLGAGITGRVAQDQRTLRVPDVLEYPGFRLSTPAIRSELCVPIISGGNVLGVVNAESTRVGFFTEHDERLMQTIADLLATGIENARLFGLADEQRKLAEALRSAAMATNSTLDFNEVLDRILTSLIPVVPHDCANIMTLALDGQTLRIIASQGYENYGISKGRMKSIQFKLQESPHLLEMLGTRAPTIIPDVAAADGWSTVEGMDWIRSYLCAPIVSEGTVIGFVNLDSSQLDFFTEQHAERLVTFASQAAIAIENATLYQELERHSVFLEQAVAEATEDLRESRDRIETILANSPDAILLLSPNGTIELCNQALTQLFGFTPDEIVGQPLCLLTTREVKEQCNRLLQQVVHQARTFRLETTGARSDGSEFDIDLALAPVQRGEAVSGIVCSIRDITELKQVARMKDAFVSNVSHELRTPITSLKLNHSLLRMNPQNGVVYLDRLDREIARLNLLIEDLLRLSRFEQGAVELDFRPVDLNAIAREYATDRMVISNDRQLSLFFEPQAESIPVRGDAGLIGQALSVLITNALNYTPAGGQIIVETPSRREDGRLWSGIIVRDTGAGISNEDLPFIFDRFYRGTAGLTSGAPGTGLGLAIAQQIMKQHGGKIEAANNKGKKAGARFTLWFPSLISDPLEQTGGKEKRDVQEADPDR